MPYDPDGIGDELFAQFAPLVEMHGAQPDMQVYMRAFGRAIQPIDDLAMDGGNGTDEPGWSQALDLNRAKDSWLRWLGQWVGYWVPEQPASFAFERGRILSRSAHRRGSIAMLREAVQEHLSAPKTVIIQERFSPVVSTAGTITVSIFSAQIATTSAKAEAAAREQKAGGLLMTFNVLSGSQWNTLVASQATWNIVVGKFADWNEVVSNPAKP